MAVALVFGLLHFLVGWLLFGIIAIGTLGLGFLLAFLTRWLVTAILLKVTDALLDVLEIRSFGVAFLAAMFLSLLGVLRDWLFR